MERVFDEIVVAVEDSAVGLEIRLDILNDLGPQGMLFLSTLLLDGMLVRDVVRLEKITATRESSQRRIRRARGGTHGHRWSIYFS